MMNITMKEIMDSIAFTQKASKAKRLAKKAETVLSAEEISLANNAGRKLLGMYDESTLCHVALNLVNADASVSERGFEAAAGDKEELIDFILYAYNESIICKYMISSQISEIDYLKDVSKIYLAHKNIKPVCVKEKYEPMKVLLSVLF